MEREIKFRGKASNHLYNGAELLHKKGDWLYGDLIHQDGRVFIAPVDIRFPAGTSFTSFAVEPDTVGQQVKKYKLFSVYEGDVVKFDRVSWDGESDDYAEVREFGIVHVAYHDDFDFTMIQWIDDIDWSIIGNIHDNPSLLHQ